MFASWYERCFWLHVKTKSAQLTYSIFQVLNFQSVRQDCTKYEHCLVFKKEFAWFSSFCCCSSILMGEGSWVKIFHFEFAYYTQYTSLCFALLCSALLCSTGIPCSVISKQLYWTLKWTGQHKWQGRQGKLIEWVGSWANYWLVILTIYLQLLDHFGCANRISNRHSRSNCINWLSVK